MATRDKFSEMLTNIKPSGKLYVETVFEYDYLFLQVYEFYQLIFDAVYTVYYSNRFASLYKISPSESTGVEAKMLEDLKKILSDLFYEIQFSLIDKNKKDKLKSIKVLLFENPIDRDKYLGITRDSVIALDEAKIKNDIMQCFREYDFFLTAAEDLKIAKDRKRKSNDSGIDENKLLMELTYTFRLNKGKKNRFAETIRETLGVSKGEFAANSNNPDYNNLRLKLKKIEDIEISSQNEYDNIMSKHRTRIKTKNR